MQPSVMSSDAALGQGVGQGYCLIQPCVMSSDAALQMSIVMQPWLRGSGEALRDECRYSPADE